MRLLPNGGKLCYNNSIVPGCKLQKADRGKWITEENILSWNVRT